MLGFQMSLFYVHINHFPQNKISWAGRSKLYQIEQSGYRKCSKILNIISESIQLCILHWIQGKQIKITEIEKRKKITYHFYKQVYRQTKCYLAHNRKWHANGSRTKTYATLTPESVCVLHRSKNTTPTTNNNNINNS